LGKKSFDEIKEKLEELGFTQETLNEDEIKFLQEKIKEINS